MGLCSSIYFSPFYGFGDTRNQACDNLITNMKHYGCIKIKTDGLKSEIPYIAYSYGGSNFTSHLNYDKISDKVWIYI